MKRQGYRDRLADHFRAHAGCWIDGRVLSQLGGAYAWRTRVSDCRVQLHMAIENQQRTVGGGVKVSEYRYVPASGQGDLFGVTS